MRRVACLLVMAVWALSPAHARALALRQTKGPASLDVRSDGGGPGLALSDTLALTLSVTGAERIEVEPPARLLEAPGWSILRRFPATNKVLETGEQRWQQSFALAPAAPGDQTLHVAPLRYRLPGGDWRTAAWDPAAIKVETQIKEADPKSLRDITAIEPLPEPPAGDWPSPWLLAVPAGLLAVALLAWRRRPSRRPRESAARRALRECDRLLARDLLARGRGKQLAILLAAIMRRYLERSHGLPARRRTSQELLQALETGDHLTAEDPAFLARFFAELDPARYAPPGDAARLAPLVEETRQFFVAKAAASRPN
jgi:hypothetical protein